MTFLIYIKLYSHCSAANNRHTKKHREKKYDCNDMTIWRHGKYGKYETIGISRQIKTTQKNWLASNIFSWKKCQECWRKNIMD